MDDTRRHDGSHGPDCFGCRIQSIQIDPRAMPTRRNNVAPARPMNNWEKGIVRDAHGGPVRVDGRVIGLKDYADRRRYFDRRIREQVQNPPARDRIAAEVRTTQP